MSAKRNVQTGHCLSRSQAIVHLIVESLERYCSRALSLNFERDDMFIHLIVESPSQRIVPLRG